MYDVARVFGSGFTLVYSICFVSFIEYEKYGHEQLNFFKRKKIGGFIELIIAKIIYLNINIFFCFSFKVFNKIILLFHRVSNSRIYFLLSFMLLSLNISNGHRD